MRTRSMASILLATLVLAGWPAGGTDARAPRAGQARERSLIEALGPGTHVTRERATGAIHGLRGGRRRLATPAELGDPRSPTAAAHAFLGRYGELFSVDAVDRQLDLDTVDASARAGTVVRYQQVMGGVPVMGGDVIVAVDRGMGVTAVRGETSPDRTVDLDARIGPGVAARLARLAVVRSTGASAGSLLADRPERWVYDPRLLDGPGLPYARLVWKVRVHDGIGSIDQLVAIDARSGDTALRFSQVRASTPPADANQRICDQLGKRENVRDRVPCTAAASLLTYAGDAHTAALATEATYDFYAKRFGYDLPADLNSSAVLISTVNYCPSPVGGGCPFENAFWNGTQMVYGAGFAKADDVVGHELTHAVTEKSSNLFYYMESGAINEALSDIMGESIDLTDGLGTDTAAKRWLIGEDIPDIGAIRDMADPGVYGQPADMDDPFWDLDPHELDSGGVHTNSGVANKAFELMVDGGPGVDPFDADKSISLDQAVAVWYRASRLLTSASDYADLGDALIAACDTLAGQAGAVRKGDGSASDDITAADCGPSGTVQQAIDWTRMPVSTRDNPPTKVPACTDPAATRTFLLDDPIDEAGSGWTFDTGAGRRWFTWDGYAYPPAGQPTDHPWSLVGDDGGTTSDRRISHDAVSIPADGKPVFLRFRHAYGFDDGSEDLQSNDRRYDGGVVEVRAGGGAWRDIGPLFLEGGYRKRIFSGDTNPLKGRLAFTAESNGYTAARANLTGIPGLSFAGTSAKLSFRLGTDSSYAGEGWFIDDVQIYTCEDPADTDGPTVSAVKAGLSVGQLSPTGGAPGFLTGTASDPAGVASVTGLVGGPGGTPFGGSVAGRIAKGSLPTDPASVQLTYLAVDELGHPAHQSVDVVVARAEETGASFGGAWSRQAGAGFSGGAVRFARAKGRSASFSLAGVKSAALVSTLGPDRGMARICRGSSCVIADLYAPTLQTRRVVYAANDLPGTGSLTVTVLGAKNGRSTGTRVDIDGLVTITP
ncbi:MAG: M4 family metallopeptidase [Chloroflexota bacterium]